MIGANAHKHLPKLKTAIKDARSIAAKLETLYGFKVRLLLDPTRDDIIDAFDDYWETLEFQDNLLIYYTGHGWLDESTDRGYWLPVDAKKGRGRNAGPTQTSQTHSNPLPLNMLWSLPTAVIPAR